MKESLAVTHPLLASQWHPTFNESLTPHQVAAGSHTKVWWKCPHGPDHEWPAEIVSRKSGKGCPFCAGLRVSVTNSLATLAPDVAAQWHPIKNGASTPEQVQAGSNTVVWWQCSVNPQHEWDASVKNRAKNGYGCPYCTRKKASPSTSLAALHPNLAEQWHPTKNGTQSPDQVTTGSGKRVWWKCPAGPEHEWLATINERTAYPSCPFCQGRKPTSTTSLLARYSDIAAQWHPSKNDPRTPDQFMPGSNEKVWWQCPEGPDHEWQATIVDRTQGTNCPFCANLRVSVTNSLTTRFPKLAAQWHPTLNKDVTPDRIIAFSSKKAWWQCPAGEDHIWQATLDSRTHGHNCPKCAGREPSKTTSLAALHPALAAQWHPTKNNPLTPEDVTAGSGIQIFWICPINPQHEWKTSVLKRAKDGNGCPICVGKQADDTTSLASLFPNLAAQWHPTKNSPLLPHNVVPGSNKLVWWQCSTNPQHEWQAIIANRTRHGQGCSYCNGGWTVQAIRLFVSSLVEHLHTLNPAELYLLFQQNGLTNTQGRSKNLIKALTTGKFPPEELKKFVRSEPSLVDQFLENRYFTLENDDNADEEITDISDDLDQPLPTVETKDILEATSHLMALSSDEEAIEFLLTSAIAKIWKHVFHAEHEAIDQANKETGNEYTEQVRTRFLNEYHQVKALDLPAGYAFYNAQGKLISPNLMQKLVAIRVRNHRRVGNWSGTGSGKTLSALLASRVIDARLTVICCPNSVVDGWRDSIHQSFPNSQVQYKTLTPHWDGQTTPSLGFVPHDQNADVPRYLILNYETFQQPAAEMRVQNLLNQDQIDCIIIDEIHYTKQRVEDMSLRRQRISELVAHAAHLNPQLAVLGLSATPVINNLQEGKSMVELVTGLAHDDLNLKPTVANCMTLHQHLTRLGIRWMPEYNITYEQRHLEIDCTRFLPEIHALGKTGTPLALEQILTRARLPIIRQQIVPKTLIYTHFVEGINQLLWNALIADGWNVGFYTGETKNGLDGFINGNIDVLIGSSAIGTGVDGLQHVCNRLIINVLPWTAAEFEQLKGRLYRQGQLRTVEMILPLTYAWINGERWSWCESKMQRLLFKKSIADAAVDGVVPEGHLRTPAHAYQDILSWLERLKNGEIQTITRPTLTAILAESSDPHPPARRQSTFSRINQRWNQTHSAATHQRLQANPEEWSQYHALYREQREEWTVIPYEEIIRWCQPRNGKTIGDFGCGEALLAQAISDRHTVYSFDHVAIDEKVIACDMAHVPLGDKSLDVVIFSLSLMGANFTEYLWEAHRTLKLDGLLHIIEATERFTDCHQFTEDLALLGFAIIQVDDKWKFTHIQAMKVKSATNKQKELHF
ncbi:MAG TPA: zinc-ribbon domain-containing protein [Ktedonobacteraceae bacterium]|nr:zinc-ribbon domain-containing protein [Ktedonobacteraceae bacterium]